MQPRPRNARPAQARALDPHEGPGSEPRRPLQDAREEREPARAEELGERELARRGARRHAAEPEDVDREAEGAERREHVAPAHLGGHLGAREEGEARGREERTAGDAAPHPLAAEGVAEQRARGTRSEAVRKAERAGVVWASPRVWSTKLP